MPTRRTITTVSTIDTTTIEMASSTRVMPSSERRRSLCTGRRLVVDLGGDRAEVDLDVEVAERRARVADGIGDVPEDRRERLRDRGRPGTGPLASRRVGLDRSARGQRGHDVD